MADGTFDPGGFFQFDLAHGAVRTRGGARVLVVSESVLAPLINAAVANGDLTAVRSLGSQLGSIETGKLADLVVVTGNPLENIRNTRNTLIVMKGGMVYDPSEILRSVVGTIGPRNADEELHWMPQGRGG